MNKGTRYGPSTEAVRAILTKYRPELVFALLFLIITVFLFRGYLHSTNPLGTDAMGLPFIIEASEPGNFFSTWISFSGLGFPDYPLPSYQVAYMAATTLGASSLDIAKFLLPFSFWLAGLAMFICARRLTGNNIASVAAVLVFTMNQAFLSQVVDGHYYFVLGYALFPLVFLLFDDLWSGRRTRFCFLVPAVLVTYGTLAPPNIVLIASLFLGLFAVVRFVVDPFPARRLVTTMAFVSLIMLFLGLSVVLANNIPTYNTSYPIQEALRWSSPTLMDGLTTKASENSFFYGNATADWVQPASLSQWADALAFGVPILAFSSLLFKGIRRRTLPFAIVSLIFIFLSKGPYEPLAGSFEWAFSNIPLMDTIRVYSRFSMFTAFSYGVMAAYLIMAIASSQPSASMPRWSHRPLKHKGAVGALMATFIGACLIVQSGAIVTGAVGAFDLPDEYQQPFEWVGGQEGDFRILNLPYMADYHNGPSSFGYPNTTTIDPGIYSLLYTGKDTAYGSSTSDFWSYFKFALDTKSLGYRDIAAIMGSTASVRYVVVQPHTSAEERDLFLSLNGLEPVAVLDGGGMVLENQNWSPRAAAFGQVSLVTGGRDMLTKLAGMGLYDPLEEGLVFVDQLAPSEVEQMLERSDRIYLRDGDLTDMVMRMAEWAPGRSIMLHTLGASHTTDSSAHWVQDKWPMLAGHTLYPSLHTTGRNSISVDLEVAGDGPYELYIKLMTGPDAGSISVSAPGQPALTFDANYPVDQPMWAKFVLNNISGPITITNSGGGQVYLERLVVAPSKEMTALREDIMGRLAEHAEKLVYVYTGTTFGEAEQIIGPEGAGAAPTAGGSLTATAGEILSNGTIALVVGMDGMETTTLRVQGEDVDRTNASVDGETFDLGSIVGGETIEVVTSGVYGLALLADERSNDTKAAAEVTYQRPNNTVYAVETNGEGPFLLRISESYNSWWSYRTEGAPAIHIPVNSIVNGYLIEDGGAVTIEYQGKMTYVAILGTMAVVLAAATSLIAYRGFKLRKKGTND